MCNNETKNRPLCGNPQIVEYAASLTLSDMYSICGNS